jgi:hypothetical protein
LKWQNHVRAKRKKTFSCRNVEIHQIAVRQIQMKAGQKKPFAGQWAEHKYEEMELEGKNLRRFFSPPPGGCDMVSPLIHRQVVGDGLVLSGAGRVGAGLSG